MVSNEGYVFKKMWEVMNKKCGSAKLFKYIV